MTSTAVPGGIVYQTSKETDAQGRLTRRSVLELVGYGLQSEEERNSFFGRKRSSRSREVGGSCVVVSDANPPPSLPTSIISTLVPSLG